MKSLTLYSLVCCAAALHLGCEAVDPGEGPGRTTLGLSSSGPGPESGEVASRPDRISAVDGPKDPGPVNDPPVPGVESVGDLNRTGYNIMDLHVVREHGVSLEGGMIKITRADGSERSGRDVIGTWFDGVYHNDLPDAEKQQLLLRVDGVVKGTDRNPDLYTYEVKILTSPRPFPLCGIDEETSEPIMAVVLPGRWDYSQGAAGDGGRIDDPQAFTFACRGYALARCIEAGYRPGESAEGEPLADYHETCVRVLRADFCGDGRVWAADGIRFSAYDALGIHRDEPPWGIEALWSQHGALCISPMMYRQFRPSCYHLLARESCGAGEGGSMKNVNAALFLTGFSGQAHPEHPTR